MRRLSFPRRSRYKAGLLGLIVIMRKAFCLIFFVSVIGVSLGQPSDSLVKRFNEYRTSLLQEKVYLHADNDLYAAGEYLWLKPYLVDASFHKPVDASKVIYVELLDTNNKPVLQAKLNANPEKGETSLYIPATIETGRYVLRAYTNLMKNLSPDFFFHKPVTIINTFKKAESPVNVSAPPNYEFQLFPEGGNLIAGVRSKVAFKISDAEGRGLSYSGWITSARNDTILQFKPFKYGLGHLYFTPGETESYTAHVKDASGKVRAFALPNIQPSGYALSIQDSVDRFLHVTVTAKNLSSAAGVYLFVHARNIISNAIYQHLEKDKAVFLLDKKDLPEGISHFTIFDEDLKPRGERLYFKPVTRKLELEILHDTTFRTRDKVELKIVALQGKEKTAKGNFSIAVVMEDQLSGPPSHGMHEYFWLTSDLPGFVEEPEFYFSDHADVKEAVDNLMLTHGWRRFKWDEIISNQRPVLKFLPESYGHLISGKITGSSTEIPSGILTYLSSPGEVFRFHVSRTDRQGEVHFQTQDLYGARKLIIQTQDPDLFTFEIDNPFATAFSKTFLNGINLTKSVESEIRSRSIAMQVRYLYESNIGAEVPVAFDSLPFYGQPDDSYLLDAYTRFPVMEEIMREYVPKVRVRRSGDEFHFLLTDVVNETVFRDDPLVLLDGVPVTADEILQFDPLKVKRLDVVARRYFLGALSSSGIVSYSTYAGDLGGFELDPRIFSIDYRGLEQQTEFYSPSYSTPERRSSPVPDYRRLLYWNSQGQTGEDGRFNTSFYTSDLPGKYFIVVEGLTEDGWTGRAVSGFRVER